jgi:heat shock protein HslJ
MREISRMPASPKPFSPTGRRTSRLSGAFPLAVLVLTLCFAWPSICAAESNDDQQNSPKVNPADQELRNSIVGLSWQVYELLGAMLHHDDRPTLRIDGEGKTGLFGGCNWLVGTTDAEAGRFAIIVPFAGSAQDCPEWQERLEATMLEALRRSVAFERNGSELALFDADGEVLIRLIERPE